MAGTTRKQARQTVEAALRIRLRAESARKQRVAPAKDGGIQ